MKKTILLLLALVVLSLTSCSASVNAPIPTPKPTSDVEEYKVIKSTGLYDTFSIDADIKLELREGQFLYPVNGEKTIKCDSITEAGTVYTLCQVEVGQTGVTGWVLVKWIERTNW